MNSLVQQYVRSYLPALFLCIMCDIEKKFLNSLGKNVYPMISYSVSISLHPVWVYIFMVHLEMGILGMGIAGIITNGIAYFLMIKLQLNQADIVDALFMPSLSELK